MVAAIGGVGGVVVASGGVGGVVVAGGVAGATMVVVAAGLVFLRRRLFFLTSFNTLPLLSGARGAAATSDTCRCTTGCGETCKMLSESEEQMLTCGFNTGLGEEDGEGDA